MLPNPRRHARWPPHGDQGTGALKAVVMRADQRRIVAQST
jgi:hypothetical protein